MGENEGDGRTVEVGLVLGIAEALRGEFGIGIDAHPGGRGSEAGVVNRAFRASAWVINKAIGPAGEDLDGVLTRILRSAALHRMAEVGVDHRRAEAMLSQEPGLGDAWLAYITLASKEVMRELLGGMPQGES